MLERIIDVITISPYFITGHDNGLDTNLIGKKESISVCKMVAILSELAHHLDISPQIDKKRRESGKCLAVGVITTGGKFEQWA